MIDILSDIQSSSVARPILTIQLPILTACLLPYAAWTLLSLTKLSNYRFSRCISSLCSMDISIIKPCPYLCRTPMTDNIIYIFQDFQHVRISRIIIAVSVHQSLFLMAKRIRQSKHLKQKNNNFSSITSQGRYTKTLLLDPFVGGLFPWKLVLHCWTRNT